MKGLSLKPLMIIGWCFCLFVSCQTTTVSQSTATAGLSTRTRMVIPTPTLGETPALTPTFHVEVTSTSTLAPTPEPSVTVTSSPISTLPPDEALATVFTLFETNGGCLLSCWWGFTPGQTDWLTAKQVLFPIAKVIYEPPESHQTLLWSVEVHLPNTDYTNVPIIHNYLIEENVIQAFEVWMQEPTSIFAPASILSTYGIPEEIYMRSGQGDTGYLLTLFYPQHGFRINYRIKEGTNDNDIISACFRGDEFTSLTIWLPEREMSFIETYTLFHRENAGVYHIPLDTAAGMDVPTFYETFSNPDTPICLETPTDIWPGW